jgi:MFS family permease
VFYRVHAPHPVLFGIGAVVAGSSFAALIIGSLSAANRLAPEGTRAKVISTYFVFAYSGLSIPVVGVGIASGYVGTFRAVLGCSIVLAVLCALSPPVSRAADVPPGRGSARTRADRSGLSYFEGLRRHHRDHERDHRPQP